jgi:hypothetical protein
MSRYDLLPERGNLTTSKEAADRKKKLGRDGPNKRRGFGFNPESDQSNPEYSNEERTRDATKIFIGQCAQAYRNGSLAATDPLAPRQIESVVRRFGGNIKWLSGDDGRRRSFHDSYCVLIKRRVPYEQVWQENAQKPAAETTEARSEKTKIEKIEESRRRTAAKSVAPTEQNKITIEKLRSRLDKRMRNVVVVKIHKSAGSV